MIAATCRYNYEAYGEKLTDTSSSGTLKTDLLYCGEQYEAKLGMYNLRARFYDPSNGRFNAMDSFSGNSSDPQSLHKYAYANRDPVNASDPSGNMTLIQLVATIAIGVGFALGLSTGKPLNVAKGIIAGAIFTWGFAIAKATKKWWDSIIEGALSAISSIIVDMLFQSLEAVSDTEIAFNAYEAFCWGFADAALGNKYNGGVDVVSNMISFALKIGQSGIEFIMSNFNEKNWLKIEKEMLDLKIKIAAALGAFVTTSVIGAILSPAKKVRPGMPSWIEQRFETRIERIIASGLYWGLQNAFPKLAEKAAEFFVDGLGKFVGKRATSGS